MLLTFTEEILKATNATLAEQGSGPLPVEIRADGSVGIFASGEFQADRLHATTGRTPTTTDAAGPTSRGVQSDAAARGLEILAAITELAKLRRDLDAGSRGMSSLGRSVFETDVRERDAVMADMREGRLHSSFASPHRRARPDVSNCWKPPATWRTASTRSRCSGTTAADAAIRRGTPAARPPRTTPPRRAGGIQHPRSKPTR